MDHHNIVALIISAVFINNFVFVRFLGIYSISRDTKNIRASIGTGLTATFVMTVASAMLYPLHYYLLAPYRLDPYFQIVIFITVIALIIQITGLLLNKFAPRLYQAASFHPLYLTANCAILGAAFIAMNNNYNLLECIVFNFASGCGLTLALLMIAGVRERLERTNVPKAFQDLPIAFISAALMSLALLGLTGAVK